MRKKTVRSHSSFSIFLVIFLVGILSFMAVRLYRAYILRQWNADSEFIVFDSNKLQIKIYTPKNEKIRTYVLPGEAYIEVSQGYGFYKLKDIPELARVEKLGEKLVAGAVSNSFGIPFDATTATVTEWDTLLIWYANWVYEEKDNTVSLQDAPIFSSEIRVDGVEIQKVDPVKIDHFLEHELWEKTLIDENMSVGIFNASAEPNIASTLSRKLENIGIRVNEISNWEEEIANECELRVLPQNQSSYTVKRLVRLFHCSIGPDSPLSRFDIMVLTKSVL